MADYGNQYIEKVETLALFEISDIVGSCKNVQRHYNLKRSFHPSLQVECCQSGVRNFPWTIVRPYRIV